MNYVASPWAIIIFLSFVAAVLGISYHFARSTKSASNYFAAGGSIHWSVNGIAFAGDYLSAASFLGICGMLAMSGYDGFLYSIGYLAGWIVALFVVAEPMKRLGKFTFTDALDAKFNSKGIQLTAAISTLLVSLFYLIPQMVGAGSLVTPLLGLPHWAGVLMVGIIVIIVVTTAGMKSTTYVQFLKGGLLIVFSIVLVFLVFSRGISTSPDQGGDKEYHKFVTLKIETLNDGTVGLEDKSYRILKQINNESSSMQFVRLEKNKIETVWSVNSEKGILEETQTIEYFEDGKVLYNGQTKDKGAFYQVGHMSELEGKTDTKTGNLNMFSFIETIRDGTVIRWLKLDVKDEGSKLRIEVSKVPVQIVEIGYKSEGPIPLMYQVAGVSTPVQTGQVEITARIEAIFAYWPMGS